MRDPIRVMLICFAPAAHPLADKSWTISLPLTAGDDPQTV